MTDPTFYSVKLGALALRIAFNFDYDEVLMLCMGLAATAYVILDFRREKRMELLTAELIDRVAKVEAQATWDDRLEERVAGYAERIAVLETRLDEWAEPAEDE